MSVLGSLRSSLLELRAVSRMAVELGKVLPVSGWGPARLLSRNAEERPSAIALRFGDDAYSWRDVQRHASRYARLFRARGVVKGSVVAVLCDNRPDFLFAELGLSKLGAVAALVNTSLRGAPLAHAINAGKPLLLFAGQEHALAVGEVRSELSLSPDRILFKADDASADVPTIDAELERLSPEDPGSVEEHAADPTAYIYTSGTTGLPKAAVITNQRYMGASLLYARVIHGLEPGSVLYVALPLYHSNAQWMGWGACMASGATMALRRRFSASAFWSDVRKHEATHFLYIGEICRYLVNAPPHPDERNHRLRMGVGNGLRADVWEAFQARFGVPTIREFYGATEGNALLVNIEGRPGMIGRLRPGHVVVACDPATGEPRRDASGLCEPVGPRETGLFLARISPFTRFDGYVDEGATRKKVVRDVKRKGDAYFDSGDLLTLHDEGWVSFADRVGDTFRWKGENVSTGEVGQVLDAATGVLESSVYGVEVKDREGRAGMASLIVGEGFDLAAFAAHVTSKLPGYQRPQFLRLQAEMSLTATFKQRKVALREEGYDPSRCPDPLFYLEGARYLPVDASVFSRIASGEIGPR